MPSEERKEFDRQVTAGIMRSLSREAGLCRILMLRSQGMLFWSLRRKTKIVRYTDSQSEVPLLKIAPKC
jgi:hypothetical protein